MNEPKRVSFWLIIGVMLVIIFIVFEIRAQQDHRCQGGHNCPDGEVATVLTGDEFRAFSLSQSLGGVDVSGCIVTTQWGIIIYQRQGYKYDVFCLARELDAVRKYADAASMRCLHKIPTKLYGERCLSVMNFKPPEIDPLDILVGQVPDERYVQQQEELEFAKEERASLADQLKQITQWLERPTTTQIDKGAERRARAREAYEQALKGDEQ